MKRRLVFLSLLLCFLTVTASSIFAQTSDSSVDNKFYSDMSAGVNAFAALGIGIDRNTYLPRHHIRIDPAGGWTFGVSEVTDPETIASYILFLCVVYNSEEAFSLDVRPDEIAYLKSFSIPFDQKSAVLLRLRRMLDTLLMFVRNQQKSDAPFSSGMLSNMRITTEGRLERVSDLASMRKNAMLSWAYAALDGMLSQEAGFLQKLVQRQIRELLLAQKYDIFLDAENSAFYSDINVVSGATSDLYLQNLWTEDMPAVLWALMNMGIDNSNALSVWNNCSAGLASIEYEGGNIDVPVSYYGANTELLWSMLLFPLEETEAAGLFRNAQFAQAVFARKEEVPGFRGVGYCSVGLYINMGIPDISEKAGMIVRSDCSSVLATAGAVISDAEAGYKWMQQMVDGRNMMTEYGVLDSVGPEGRSDVISSRSNYLSFVAMKNRISDYVTAFFAAKGKGDSLISYLDRIEGIAGREIIDGEISYASDDFPLPSEDVVFGDSLLYSAQSEAVDVLDRMDLDLYGDAVNRAFLPNVNVSVETDADGVSALFDIPKNAVMKERFARWSMFLEAPFLVPVVYDDLRIVISGDESFVPFSVTLQRDDTALSKPVLIDSKVKFKKDDEGNRIYDFPLTVFSRFAYLPANRIVFNVADPKSTRHLTYQGRIVVKSLTLYREDADLEVGPGSVISSDEIKAKVDENGFRPGDYSLPENADPVADGYPEFLSSGAYSDAVPRISREHNGTVYMEYESVDLEKGYSGAWVATDKFRLAGEYMVFDCMAGPFGGIPDMLRIEAKYQWENTGEQKLEAAWNIDIKKAGVNRSSWVRIAVPIPETWKSKNINLFNFIYENWVGKQSDGSLYISEIGFVRKGDDLKERGVYVIDALEYNNCFDLMRLDSFDSSDDVEAVFKGGVLRLKGDGGWMAVKVYPSLFDVNMKRNISLSGSSPSGASFDVELKYGGIKLFVTDHVELAGGAVNEKKVDLNMKNDSDPCDVIAFSNIKGECELTALDLQ